MKDCIEIRELAKEMDVHYATVKYHISRLQIKMLRNNNTLSVTLKDADRIRATRKKRYDDWVQIRTIAKELLCTTYELSSLCDKKGFEKRKVLHDTIKGSAVISVSPETADKIRDIKAPKRTAKAQSSKTLPSDALANRKEGYYQRITPVTMMESFQGGS